MNAVYKGEVRTLPVGTRGCRNVRRFYKRLSNKIARLAARRAVQKGA